MSTHRHCIASAAKSCLPISPKAYHTDSPIQNKKPVKKPSVEKEATRIRFHHNWVEGILPMNSVCLVCDGSINLFDGFNGCECTRCEKTVHKDCAELSEICKPIHRNLIYVPEIDDDLELETASDELIKKKQLEVQSNPKLTRRKPLLVMINPKSGGQVGAELKRQFSSLLSPEQVFDINALGGPSEILKRFRKVRNLRILACGGDGTVGWVMNVLDDLNFKPYPPVAILPLGIGNDLAQTFKWGPGYSDESISMLLHQIEDATPSNLDRWKLTVTVTDPVTKDPVSKTTIMNNYMSLGIDAQIALDFHHLRRDTPELCASVVLNKFWYATYGAKALFTGLENLEDFITLIVDGKQVELPDDVEGLIAVNLPSYAGGCNLWGVAEDPRYQKSAIDDNLIEICALQGVFHLGTIQIKWNNGIRIAQGRDIKMIVKPKDQAPMQIDGEPMLLSEGVIEIKPHNQSVMLRKTEK